MSSSFMADIGAMGAEVITAKKSTSRANNTEMRMEDFLKLMVVQLQSQTIDDTADTGEMLNQLVQMQMVTALSNMTDASIMSYASSLVGKEVTIGYTDKENNFHQEVLNVTGTGVYNGQQVIFCDDGKMYQLNQIMGVGRIPELKEDGEEDENPEMTEGELGERLANYNALIASIQDGSFNADSPGSTDNRTGIDEIGAVNAADTENIAESGTETEAEAEAEAETAGKTSDPLELGLLNDMLVKPTYDGSQGADANETE